MKWQRILFLLSFPAAIIPSTEGQEAITIDPLQTYQEFRGFGTCLTPWVTDMVNLYKSSSFQEIYTTEMGMNLLRVDVMPYVHPEVSNAADISYENFNIRSGGQQHAGNERTGVFLDFAKAIHGINPDVKVIQTVWSFPGWMKTNNSHLNGGTIKPSHYAHAARYLIEHIRLFESEGVPTLAVSFANEPQFAQFYNSQVIEPEDYAAFLAVLGPAMEEAGYGDVLIYGPEHMTHDSDENANYLEAIFSHPTAGAYLDAFASHGYRDGVIFDPSLPDSGYIRTRVQDPNGLEFWMTEAGSGGHAYHNALEELGVMIHEHLTTAETSLFTPWQVTGSGETEHNLMVLGEHRPKSRVLQHYARAVRPGMVQVGVEHDGDLRVAAFADPDAGTLGIVILNLRGFDTSTNLNLRWMDSGEFEVRRMVQARPFEILSPVSLSDGEMSVPVPGDGILSLYGENLDFGSLPEREAFQIAYGAGELEIPGYAQDITLRVEAPDGYSWEGAFSADRIARFERDWDSGTGSGYLRIRIAGNPSESDFRRLVVSANDRRVTLKQRPKEDPPVTFWERLAPEIGMEFKATENLNPGDHGIGLIEDSAWPYVYSVAMEGWLFVDIESEVNGIRAYDFNGERWLWLSNELGWSYEYADGTWIPVSGVNES